MARKVSGKVYQSGKKKFYYLRYQMDGKDNRVRLMDTAGKPITSKEDAQAAANRILAHIHESDRTEQLRKLKNDIQDAEESAVIAELNMRNAAASIDKGWELFMSCPKRPKSCRMIKIAKYSTAANYHAYYERFRKWIAEACPAVHLLSEVSNNIAVEFMETVRATGATGTYNKYLQFLKCFYKTLLEAGKIASVNPFGEIEREDMTYHSKKELSREQIYSLIQSADGELRVLLALGYFCGFRLGDCCTLKWNEIDLERGIIERIPRKTARTVKDPAQSVVKVGIPRSLLDMLLELPEDGVYVLPKAAADYLGGRKPAISHKIQAHFIRCGISTTEERMDGSGARAIAVYGFHSLRYSYVSHNAEAGTPAAVIQRNAGHANPAMTEHYTRISDDNALKYAAALAMPELEEGNVIHGPEPEREELRRIVETWDIERVRRLLDFAERLK